VNKIHSIVRSETIGKWVAASEFTYARKKKTARCTVLIGAVMFAFGGVGVVGATDTCTTENCVTDSEIVDVEKQSTVSNASARVGDLEGVLIDSSRYFQANGANDGTDDAAATGTNAVAVGPYASASGYNSAAMGVHTSADGDYGVAIGEHASASAYQSIAIGSGANVDAAANYGLAFGRNARVEAAAMNSVALGDASVARRNYVVSVGDVGYERQIINVAAGTQDTDAVNFGQLKSYVTDNGGNPLVVAYDDGNKASVTLGNAGTPAALRQVAEGELSATSTDAVNGSQLYATHQQVTQNTSGITTLNTQVTSLDGRVTDNEGNITSLLEKVNNGGIGLVKQDTATGNIMVAAGTGGNGVNMAGTDGPRVISGVANGVDNGDAVTIAQLKAIGAMDPIGNPLTVLTYDDISLDSATLGGALGTTIRNLSAGLIAAGSMQAVNGGQLFDLQQNFQNKFDSLTGQVGDLNDRVTVIEQGHGGPGSGGGSASPGTGDNSLVVGEGADASGSNTVAVGNGSTASGNNSTATGAGSTASGNNSTANGNNAVASGNGSTAVGQGASATGDYATAVGNNANALANNSVALGANSVADRDNSVSVGSQGNERQITNVAAGTARTDAANWGQVQDAVNGVQDWANRKFNRVDRRIDRMGAMSAAYGQMAFSAQGINTPNKVGVGIGNQNGQSAIAVGYSRQIKPNMNLSFGGSASAGDASVGAGLSVGW
jgi:trimeric autotransporter adhesin